MWVADLGDADAIAELALQAWDTLGGIDVLVNNAAVPKRRAVTALDPRDAEAVMAVNFFAPMRLTLACCRECWPATPVSSSTCPASAAELGIIHESAYCASKFALCGWSEALAVDLHGTGVSVKLIQPGPIDTEIWDQPDNDDPIYNGPKVPPDAVAEGIIAALGDSRFEHYVPDLKAVVDGKNADIDAFIAGAATMARP